MNVISSTPGQRKGILSYRGLNVLHNLRHLQRTPRTASTAVMIAPLAEKHESDEDELGTQLIHHAVFSEKS